MKYRIQIIAGVEYYGNGERSPASMRANAITAIAAYTVDRFGGVTIRDHIGSWRNPKTGFVVSENGITVEVLTDSPLRTNSVHPDEHIHAIREQANALATFIKSLLQQSSVVVVIDEPEIEFV